MTATDRTVKWDQDRKDRGMGPGQIGPRNGARTVRTRTDGDRMTSSTMRDG